MLVVVQRQIECCAMSFLLGRQQGMVLKSTKRISEDSYLFLYLKVKPLYHSRIGSLTATNT